MKPCFTIPGRNCPEPDEDVKGYKCKVCGWEVPTKEQRRINLENNLDYFCNIINPLNY